MCLEDSSSFQIFFININCAINLSHLGQAIIAVALDTGHALSVARHNESVTKNRSVLSKIINCLKFVVTLNLKFVVRGHDEHKDSLNPGVFRGLLGFTSNLDTCLKLQLVSAAVFEGSSTMVRNELSQSILEIGKQEISDEISISKYLAVLCDETTDVFDKSHVIVVLYLGAKKVVSRLKGFWAFLSPLV